MGFPTGEPYKGTDEQKKTVENQYLRKALFMRKHKTPICKSFSFTPLFSHNSNRNTTRER